MLSVIMLSVIYAEYHLCLLSFILSVIYAVSFMLSVLYFGCLLYNVPFFAEYPT
jgi:hypothetical protein